MSELDILKKKIEEGEVATISLFLDDNTEMKCDISAIFQVEDKVYIALTDKIPEEWLFTRDRADKIFEKYGR